MPLIPWRIAAVAALLALVAACSDSQQQLKSADDSADDIPIGTGFDFYVLSLSWSPGYCRSLGDRANRQQCKRSDPFGFVVHGLWPQYTNGYPEFCRSDEPGSVERDLAASMFDIMPSRGLVDHQWKKHGTCSGLSQVDYFKVTRQALSAIAIPEGFQSRRQIDSLHPDAVETAFRIANPEMPASSVAVTCDRRFLRDVRICLSKTLDGYVSCPQVDRRDCKLTSVVVPPNSR